MLHETHFVLDLTHIQCGSPLEQLKIVSDLTVAEG
jgi:hypothetical protein